MKRAYALAVAVMTTPSPSTAESRHGPPSFPCAAAKAVVERSVCADATGDLGWLDRMTKRLYEAGVAVSGGSRNAVIEDQRRWLDRRDECASSRASTPVPQCVRRAYVERIEQLERPFDPAGIGGSYRGDNGSITVVALPDAGAEVAIDGERDAVTSKRCAIEVKGSIEGQRVGDADEKRAGPCTEVHFVKKGVLKVKTGTCPRRCGGQTGFDGIYAKSSTSKTPAAVRKDCGVEKSDFEKVLCSDDAVQAADATMSRTYFETLKRLDPERKEKLLEEQRAWLAHLRGKAMPEEDRWFTPADTAIDSLSERTAAITRDFAVEGYAGEPRSTEWDPDRLPVSDDPTRPFEGTWLSESRVQGAVLSLATTLYQEGTRVCGIREDWASGRFYEGAVLAVADGDSAKIVATCDGGEEGPCNAGITEESEPLWSRVDGDALKICGNVLAAGGPGSEACRRTVPGSVRAGFKAGEPAARSSGWIARCLRDPSFPRIGDEHAEPRKR